MRKIHLKEMALVFVFGFATLSASTALGQVVPPLPYPDTAPPPPAGDVVPAPTADPAPTAPAASAPTGNPAPFQGAPNAMMPMPAPAPMSGGMACGDNCGDSCGANGGACGINGACGNGGKPGYNPMFGGMNPFARNGNCPPGMGGRGMMGSMGMVAGGRMGMGRGAGYGSCPPGYGGRGYGAGGRFGGRGYGAGACGNYGYGDMGWNMPVASPIIRRNAQYTNWSAQPWGSAGAAAVGYPMVAQPTDTTQLGFGYMQVPYWRNDRSKYPPMPNPAAYHNRQALAPTGYNYYPRVYRRIPIPHKYMGPMASATPQRRPMPPQARPQQDGPWKNQRSAQEAEMIARRQQMSRDPRMQQRPGMMRPPQQQKRSTFASMLSWLKKPSQQQIRRVGYNSPR